LREDDKIEAKKEVIEKRIKSTVIRRRARVVQPPPEEVKVAQPPKEEAAEEKKQARKKAAPAVVKVEEKAKAPASVIVRKAKPKETPQAARPERKTAKKEEKAPSPPSETPTVKKHKKPTVDVEKKEKPTKKRIYQQTRKREVITKEALLARGDMPFERGGRRRKKVKKEAGKKTEITTPKAIKRIIKISEFITVADLAKRMGVKAPELIKKLMQLGNMATVNQALDSDTATLIASEFGYEVENVALEMDTLLIEEEAREEDLQPRPPVVTIMGHVDHGKTTLLDSIRQTDVTAGESGGITQHIGAYDVKLENGDVVFLDTPGHEAFTSMRARGATVTDVVVLVVAADDGVKPQTIEAIDHAKAADVPIIVAINKIDKEEADPERVKSELSNHEVIPEDWGGEDVFVEVSAITGQGIDDLLESILLVSEVLELKAPVEGPASGVVVEASVEKGRGAVATVLVQKGTLKKGDMILCGTEYGRVRAMLDENGKPIEAAGPSIPVSVLGLSGAPAAGDNMVAVANERKAKEIADMRRTQEKESRFATQQAAKLDAMFAGMKQGENHIVNILIKADVQGSVEALREALLNLSTEEVQVKFISTGVGGINESDAILAQASNAIIIGFNVRADATARRTISEAGLDLRYYSIIYEVIDDVRDAMSGLLSPEVKEEFLGLAEVKDVFRGSGFGAVAGCLVTDGMVKKGSPIRVLRDNVVIYEGELESLRRHKDDVKEVRTGTECGIAVKNYNDVKVGDQIECYERTEIERKL